MKTAYAYYFKSVDEIKISKSLAMASMIDGLITPFAIVHVIPAPNYKLANRPTPEGIQSMDIVRVDKQTMQIISIVYLIAAYKQELPFKNILPEEEHFKR